MPKRTYQPSQKKRLTTHGFLARKKRGSSGVITARRRKGRTQLTVQKSK